MSDCPGEQNPDHHTLHLLTGENRHVWLSSQNVDLDLLKVFPLKLRELNCRGSVSFALCSNIVYGFMRKISKVILYNLKVFLSFTPEHFLSKFFTQRTCEVSSPAVESPAQATKGSKQMHVWRHAFDDIARFFELISKKLHVFPQKIYNCVLVLL
mgnify:CR=1 FL=1